MPPAPWPGGRAGWAQDCPSQSFATVVPSPWHSRFLPEANSIRQSYVSYAGNRECFFCLLSIPLTKVSGSQRNRGRGSREGRHLTTNVELRTSNERYRAEMPLFIRRSKFDVR